MKIIQDWNWPLKQAATKAPHNHENKYESEARKIAANYQSGLYLSATVGADSAGQITGMAGRMFHSIGGLRLSD